MPHLKKSNGGSFVISLDFELMWGVRDVLSLQTYGNNIRGVHTALPGILDCFTKYNISGTFSTVGLLFFKDKEEILKNLPQLLPGYADSNLSPYGTYMENNVGLNSEDDPYHYGLNLINKIKDTPGQEIGTHTFSHYYCLESGQTAEEFKADLSAAVSIAEKRGVKITSIVFPRNQYNENYISLCQEAGITSYRNNKNSRLYKASAFKEDTLFRRALRLLDTYINISGNNCHDLTQTPKGLPVNIPSSRFLRPYNKKLKLLDDLRLKRITNSMTHAAKHNLMYHLWWHPHNFGINQEENFKFLEQILSHYLYLNKKYSFSSYTMSELAELYKS